MAKVRFYAVVRGRQTGFFNRWENGAKEQVDGFKGALHRSFTTLELAEEWYRQNSTLGSLHSPVFHFSTVPLATEVQTIQPELNVIQPALNRYVVYLIVDPRDNRAFYVGQTSSLERRKAQHLRNALPDSHYKVGQRMAEILGRGEEPVFRAVQECATEEDSLRAESEWVKRCSQRGDTLCNRWREHRELRELFGAD